MNPVSNTAYFCCGVRMLDAQKEYPICNDRYAERFMDKRGRELFKPFESEIFSNISTATRCKIIDEILLEKLAINNDINVITVGCGFDTRPYRLEGGNWFEIDEMPIIERKNQVLPISDCKNSIERISIDFSSQNLSDKINHIDNKKYTLFIIEGVLMYLESKSIDKTIRILQESFPNHDLLCDVMTKKFFKKNIQKFHEKIINMGSRFIFCPEKPETIFSENGYKKIQSIEMLKRANQCGAITREAGVPKAVFVLVMSLIKRSLKGYAVHHFRYEQS